MTETKFTPGPWVVENPVGEEVGLTIVQDGLKPGEWTFLALVAKHDGDDGRRISSREQRANAHLIAAAPDLYEMLSDCISSMQAIGVKGLDQEIKNGLTALAKARGEA